MRICRPADGLTRSSLPFYSLCKGQNLPGHELAARCSQHRCHLVKLGLQRASNDFLTSLDLGIGVLSEMESAITTTYL